MQVTINVPDNIVPIVAEGIRAIWPDEAYTTMSDAQVVDAGVKRAIMQHAQTFLDARANKKAQDAAAPARNETEAAMNALRGQKP